MVQLAERGKSRCRQITSIKSQMRGSARRASIDMSCSKGVQYFTKRQRSLNISLNLRLSKQRNFGVKHGPMELHEIDMLNPHFVKVPTSSERKISMEPFDGSEIQKGLGAGSVQSGLLLLVKIDLAERVCGFCWPE